VCLAVSPAHRQAQGEGMRFPLFASAELAGLGKFDSVGKTSKSDSVSGKIIGYIVFYLKRNKIAVISLNRFGQQPVKI